MSSSETTHSRLCPPKLVTIPLGPVVARIKTLEVEALVALKGAVADGFRGVSAVMGRLVRVERRFWRLHARNERVERKRAMLADAEARAGVRDALGGLGALRAWEDRARALEAAEADEVLAAGREAVAEDADAPVSASGEVPEWYLRMRGEEALAGGEETGSHERGCEEEGLDPRLGGDERTEKREARSGLRKGEGTGQDMCPVPCPREGERGAGLNDGVDPSFRWDERGLGERWRLLRLEGRRGARRKGRRSSARANRALSSAARRGEPRIAVWPCELMTRAERRGRGVSFRVRAQDRAPVVVGGLVIQPVELPYPDF